MSEYCINIVHLYPDLLNLYGDKGNIECLKHRLLWRNIDVNVKEYNAESTELDFSDADIIFLGGGSDREQEIVCEKLLAYKDVLKEYIEKDKTLVALCGGFELLGASYGTKSNKKVGLGLFDFSADYPDNNSRLIGNVVIECQGIEGYVVGFENHLGRINIGNRKPLGKIKKGYGNDGSSVNEGLIYKNVYASYLHGPLFPKNPQLCDMILKKTLNCKYDSFDSLTQLDDKLENMANETMIKTLL